MNTPVYNFDVQAVGSVSNSLPTFSAPRGGISFIAPPTGTPTYTITKGTLQGVTLGPLIKSYPRQSGRTTMMLRAAASAKARGERIMIWANDNKHQSFMIFMGEKLGLKREDFRIYNPSPAWRGKWRGYEHFVDHYTEENHPEIWDEITDPFDLMIEHTAELEQTFKDVAAAMAITTQAAEDMILKASVS
jgi:hypothetical protein